MRILVTGGAGFIGSHVVDHLVEHEHQPFVIDNLSTGNRSHLPSQVPLFVQDLNDAARLRKIFLDIKPEIVCHQAAQISISRSIQNPASDAQTNIIGLLNVLEQSLSAGVRRIVFASSGGALYGNVSLPAAEALACAPVSPYGISKWCGEQYLRFFAGEHGISAVCLRYSNVYGPRQNPHNQSGVVATFCHQMLTGGQWAIFGDGSLIRDYVHVHDVACANVLAIESVLPEPFIALNIGTGIGTTTESLAEHLIRSANQIIAKGNPGVTIPAPQRGIQRPSDIRSSLVDAEYARKVLNWEPTVFIDRGLTETMEWFANNINRPDDSST